MFQSSRQEAVRADSIVARIALEATQVRWPGFCRNRRLPYVRENLLHPITETANHSRRVLRRREHRARGRGVVGGGTHWSETGVLAGEAADAGIVTAGWAKREELGGEEGFAGAVRWLVVAPASADIHGGYVLSGRDVESGERRSGRSARDRWSMEVEDKHRGEETAGGNGSADTLVDSMALGDGRAGGANGGRETPERRTGVGRKGGCPVPGQAQLAIRHHSGRVHPMAGVSVYCEPSVKQGPYLALQCPRCGVQKRYAGERKAQLPDNCYHCVTRYEDRYEIG